MKRLVLIAHNVRSAHNVGSLLRTADGLGIDNVYLSGYSPYPALKNDSRLPHIRAKAERRIHKTALGAEASVSWDYTDDLPSLIVRLKADGFIMLALEQTPSAVDLRRFKPGMDAALIVGNEIDGIDSGILKLCDRILMIPMAGRKESFNVAAAAAMALYHLSSS